MHEYPSIKFQPDRSLTLGHQSSWSWDKDLWQGKSGSSELYHSISQPPQLGVLKHYQENSENYIRLEDALNTEVYSYETLEKLQVKVPRLLGINRQDNLLFKEYIPGPTVMECLREGPLPEEVLRKAWSMAQSAQAQGFNLDWFPANFVWDRGELFYIDYEVQPWMEEWSFQEWGAWYWFHPEGFQEFLKTKSGDCINYPGTPKPYREEHIEGRYRNFLVKLRQI